MVKYGWIGLMLFATASLAATLPDPTTPLSGGAPVTGASASTSVGLPQLKSIVYGRNHRSAVLDRSVYREGMTVNGFKIQRILADRVILEGADGRHTLRLFSTQVRFN